MEAFAKFKRRAVARRCFALAAIVEGRKERAGWDGVVGAAEMLGVFGAILIVQYTQQVTTSYKKKGG